eukprot:10026337-Alexandrium_andersonii.AAC.1
MQTAPVQIPIIHRTLLVVSDKKRGVRRGHAFVFEQRDALGRIQKLFNLPSAIPGRRRGTRNC